MKPIAAPPSDLILDGSKLAWHLDRVRAWERGERIAPITIDMALTTDCQAACRFCYARLQANERQRITIPVMERFLTDCAEIGVRAISLVSDGESTMNPAYVYTIQRGRELGLSMASGTNGYLVTPVIAEQVLPCLDYIRVNYNGGTPESCARIMGVSPEFSRRVLDNVRHMVVLKQLGHLPATIGLQMVLMPDYAEEILPLAKLAVDLGVDYLVIKHCSDDEAGSLGVDYSRYPLLQPLLEQAEAMSTTRTQIVAKWSKIMAGRYRSYRRCYGPPFILQLSGSGLVAPCGMLFGQKYAKFHIGNIVEQSFKSIWRSERYWEVMNYLRSEAFDARRHCGSLCLQHKTNEVLNGLLQGERALKETEGERPLHVNFI